MSMKSAVKFGASVAVLAWTIPPALAQDAVVPAQTVPAAPVAEAQDDAGLEDIVVTANKRAENVQDVPSSVLAMTAAGLERANVRDFDDLVKAAPSVTITKTSQPANNSINIRGIGTYAYSISTQPSVVVVIDDIPQAFQAAAFTSLADVAQIEVLRGPQSTLFGKAASAGAINITTMAPSDKLSGRAEVLFTDDGEQRVQGTLSGPISSTLKARLSASYSKYRGTIYNTYTGNWLNGQSDVVLRGKLLWEPSESTSVALSPYFVRSKSTCCAPAQYFLSPGVTFSKSNINQSVILGGIVPGSNNRLTRMDIDAKGDSRDWGAGLKASHTFDGGLTLTSISSFDRYELIDLQDTDSSAFDFRTIAPTAPAGGSANGGFFKINTITQELRLTSPDGGPFRYVAGLFYSSTKSTRDYVRGSNTLGNFNGLASLPSTNSIAYSSYFTQSSQQTYAAFGQATYDVSNAFSITGGLRVHRENIRYRFRDRGNNVTYGMPDCATATPTASVKISTCDSDTVVTGKAALQFRPSDDVMLFASYARGYKGLAYDLTSTYTVRTPLASGPLKGVPVADAVAARQPVAPENSDAFELGFKTSLLDDRVTFNMTAFYEVFRGFQAQSRDDTTGQNILNSLGKVTSRGVETEISARLSRDFTLNAYGAYTVARMDDFPNATCFPQQTVAQGCVGGIQNLSGKPLPNAPRWNLSANGQYDIPLGDNTKAFLLASAHYQSKVIFSLLQDPDSVQKGYALVNLGAGIETGPVKVTLFVNNLFDKHYVLTSGRDGVWNYSVGAATPTLAVNYKPGRDSNRYVGIRTSVSF
ncbi:TonB-dependent receptor [Sphingomonas alpina]|uniref:TonB-dependent receptor n=1 Tax=Sphingomonas alpina TaxID=653931 RepID=A0A7H0LEY0_9SPHN|nr:TonB-dependent receptor [Sphingomonas alpina]QNQ08233.1 TonB-dependent receptor [Sphingomonas alpina]